MQILNMGSFIEEYKEEWEFLAKGSTKRERDIAAVLRSIAREIEGPQYVDWYDVRETIEWCMVHIRERAPHSSISPTKVDMTATDISSNKYTVTYANT